MASQRASAGVVSVIVGSAAYWGAEAEIVRTYFAAPGRSAETDARWLLRQCHKELVDGVVQRVVDMQRRLTLDTLLPGGVELDEETPAEVADFLAFAEACRVCRGAEQPLDLAEVLAARWDENDALADLRRRHCESHGELGALAQAFTEGGYCTLYSIGAQLASTEARDRAIARACRLTYGDEWEHMLSAVVRIDAARLDRSDVALLRDLSRAQGRARLRMRNAQFGHPVGNARLAELEAGGGAPVEFDWVRAGLRPD